MATRGEGRDEAWMRVLFGAVLSASMGFVALGIAIGLTWPQHHVTTAGLLSFGAGMLLITGGIGLVVSAQRAWHHGQ